MSYAAPRGKILLEQLPHPVFVTQKMEHGRLVMHICGSRGCRILSNTLHVA
jgi:hypothetical protein